MDALKRSRSGHASAITRIYNKLQNIANDDPTTFDVTHLQWQLEKVNLSDSSYRKLHCEICETYSDKIDDEVEADILDQYDDSVEKVVSLIEKHPLYLCLSYKAMTPDQKQSHVGVITYVLTVCIQATR